MPGLIRAFLTWLVIYVLLFFVIAVIGSALGGFGFSSYEVLLLLLVSIGLTVVVLRRRARSTVDEAGAPPSS